MRVISTFILCFCLLSCRDRQEIVPDEFSIAAAQNWHTAHVLQLNSPILRRTISGKSGRVQVAVQPDWTRAILRQDTSGKAYVEVPVQTEPKYDLAGKGERRLVYFRNASGAVEAYSAEFLADKDYVKRKNGKIDARDFTGVVMYYHLDRKGVYAGGTIVNGKATVFGKAVPSDSATAKGGRVRGNRYQVCDERVYCHDVTGTGGSGVYSTATGYYYGEGSLYPVTHYQQQNCYSTIYCYDIEVPDQPMPQPSVPANSGGNAGSGSGSGEGQPQWMQEYIDWQKAELENAEKKYFYDNIVHPGEDKPAIDIDKFIDCFGGTFTNESTYKVILYVEEPLPGTGLGKNGLNVGHTFVGFEKTTNGNKITQNAGFYNVSKSLGNVPSKICDNGGSPYTTKIAFNVTGNQFRDAVNGVKYLKSEIIYNVFDFNCTTAAFYVMDAAEIAVPKTITTFPYGVGSGYSPGQLGKDLRTQKSNNSGFDAQGGNSPASKGPC